ncbi:type V toxin-antitoxin system endoribonuclease antitoxin GhoS [Erwinia sp.]|uniref:type V toxin-antitoxin system endoribonuclease antitoxin GhoS n=1 Tax=Erwinia citreus TaxID=558 RepID=UPI003C76D5A0
MSASDITQYVVTFRYQEEGLSDILELNSVLTNAGFTTTLHDAEGLAHELGTNTFGLTSPQDKEKVREQAEKLAEVALDQKPDVDVQTLEAFLQDNKS